MKSMRLENLKFQDAQSMKTMTMSMKMTFI
jgi:hypothetical protein